MKIAIVGYGKMGKTIYSLLKDSEHTVTSVVDPSSDDSEVTSRTINEKALKESDVVIDFTTPESALSNAKLYSKIGSAAVIGTTGWVKGEETLSLLRTGRERIIYSGNFSLGVISFLRIVKTAATLLDAVGGYDPAIVEVHHCEKIDSPSGTALMMAERIFSSMSGKKSVLCGNSEGKIDKGSLQISSVRTGWNPGEHIVTFDSVADSIKIEHRARGREGFAKGAIQAALWIVRQECGIYTMEDMVKGLWEE